MKNYFLLLILCLSVHSYAQTIATDRPDQTESSATIPAGALQIESGITLQYFDEELRYHQHLLPTTLFRYGLWDFLELRFVTSVEKIGIGDYRAYGMSDLQAGFKVQLYQRPEAATEVAFLSHLILPTGSGLSPADQWGLGSRFLISHALSEKTSLGYNLGFNYYGDDDYDYIYTLALSRKVNDKTSVYIEPYGEFNQEEWLSSFDAGLAYLLRDNIQLDLSFGTGLNHNMNYFSVGVSWLALAR